MTFIKKKIEIKYSLCFIYSIAYAEISFFIFSINFISYIPYADQDGVRESRSPLENSYLFKLSYKITKKYAPPPTPANLNNRQTPTPLEKFSGSMQASSSISTKSWTYWTLQCYWGFFYHYHWLNSVGKQCAKNITCLTFFFTIQVAN